MSNTHQIQPHGYYSNSTGLPKWLSTSMEVVGNVVLIKTKSGPVELDENDLLLRNEDNTITIFTQGMNVSL